MDGNHVLIWGEEHRDGFNNFFILLSVQSPDVSWLLPDGAWLSRKELFDPVHSA